MQIYWPGLVIGVLLLALSIFLYIKRDAVANFTDKSVSRLFGEKMFEKLGGSEEQTSANVLLSLVGGIAMGAAIIIDSLTGAMR